MTRYRIKTKEEFIEEFGERWRDFRRCDVWFADSMDYLFGQKIEDGIYEYHGIIIDSKDFDMDSKSMCFQIHNGGWTISMDMLKEILPNYNEKKTLVYD